MSQLVERLSQPEMGGAHFFQRRLEAERFQEYGWQEPYESRGSRMVLWGTGGEIPPVYPTLQSSSVAFVTCFRYYPFLIIYDRRLLGNTVGQFTG